MDFYLPDDFDPKNFDCSVGLHGAKESFLEHYTRLQKQRFLHALTQEFVSQAALREVSIAVYDEGQAIDVVLTFAPDYDAEDDANYFEARAIEHSLMAAYSPELQKFCDNRVLSRAMLLGEDGAPRYANSRDLLVEIELADLKH